MSKKKKPGVRATVTDNGSCVPQSTAHSFRRRMEMPPQSLAKMKEVLAQGLPMKIALDVTSKIYAPLVGGKKAPGDGEIIIDEQAIQPPDQGGDIPEEQAPALTSPGVGCELTGVTVEIYAVAVFQPKYSNSP